MVYIYQRPHLYIPKEFQDGLVVAYDGTHNSTLITDVSGNSKHGVANGGLVFARKNNAGLFKMDGTDDYISYSDTSTIANNITINIIAKVASTNTGALFGIRSDGSTSTNASGILCDTYDSTSTTYGPGLRLFKATGPSSVVNLFTSKDLRGGKYYLITAIISTAGMKLYVDSSLINSNTDGTDIYYDPADVASSVGVWYLSGSPTRFFTGNIGLFMVHAKVLSEKQIQRIYEFFRQWYHD